MSRFIAAVAIAAALFSTPLFARDRVAEGEAELAEMLEGRVAGEAQSCITVSAIGHDLRVVEGVGLVYDRGNTIWVGRASRPERLGFDDLPVIHRTGSSLCRTDRITTVDRYNGMFSGIIFIEEFVPYRRAEDAG